MLAIGRSQHTSAGKTTISVRSVQYANRPSKVTGKKNSAALRRMYLLAGLSFVLLAFLGAILPVLPTTPFLILANSCFMRSSPKWQKWLMRLPVWGQILKDWETHRAVKPGTKRLAILMLAIALIVTVLSSRLSPIALILFLAVVLVGVTVIWRLPVMRGNHKSVCI
jgi:uncharacterized membrane protein YbaN (DUF454 family)